MSETVIMVNASIKIEGTATTDWVDKAAKVTSDPCAHPTLKRALADALDQDPAAAVKDAETVYRIMLERALAQPSREWRWRTQPTWLLGLQFPQHPADGHGGPWHRP